MQNNKRLHTDKFKNKKQPLLKNIYGLLLLLFCIPNFNLFAADHIDGPISIQHAVADITDLFAFASPDKPGNLVLIANIYPTTPQTGHFSDRIHYDFLLRPASIKQNSPHPLFQVGAQSRISCQFETPVKKHEPHWVTCQGHHDKRVRIQVDDTQSKMSDSGLRVFAGRRSDPFFFNSGWIKDVTRKSVISDPNNNNIMEDMNVLSIVLEINLAKYFGKNPPVLIALAVETLTDDFEKTDKQKDLRRIDWMGRSEITNISMIAHQGDEDLRDRYNQETPFSVSSPNIDLYRKRLRKNIDYYDNLDAKQDWSTAMADHYVELLLNDYLVIDMSKPCDSTGYLAIEKSMLQGEIAQNCGGRHPNDDVMDTLFTTFINANKGERIRDGVDKPARPSVNQFPYLVDPDNSLWGGMKAWIARFLISL